MLAYDVATGREVVNVELFHPGQGDLTNAKNSHASPTPIVDGDRVYVHFGALGTAALSTTGEIVWKTRLPYQSQHGNGGSPILYGDLLIVSCDGSDDAYVVALDKRTGKTRWRTGRHSPFDQAYSTPLVIRVGERDEVVSAGAYRAAAYDPQTGKEIWRVAYADGFSNVPRPVYGHGLVFIATGFQQPTLLAVRADGAGDVTRTHIAWTLRRGAADTFTRSSSATSSTSSTTATSRSASTREPASCGGFNGWAAATAGVTDLRRRPHLFPEQRRRRHRDRAGEGIQAPRDEPT